MEAVFRKQILVIHVTSRTSSAATCRPAADGIIFDFNCSLFLFCLESFILVSAVQIYIYIYMLISDSHVH